VKIWTEQEIEDYTQKLREREALFLKQNGRPRSLQDVLNALYHKVIRDGNRVLVAETSTGEVIEEGYKEGDYFVNIDPVSRPEIRRTKFTHVLQLEAEEDNRRFKYKEA